MTQGVQEQRGRLPAVEAESHFVQIGREMFCTDTVPRPDYSALEQAKGGFNGVRVNVAINVDLRLMLDCFMLRGHCDALDRRRIGIQFVGHDYVNICAHVLSDEVRQRAALYVSRMKETEIAATLTDAHYDLLVGISVSGFAVGVLFSADVGFIYFDRAIHHRTFYFLHGGPDAMAEIPCRLVANSECALDLVRRHALACFTEEQRSEKPFLQGQMRVVEDRACCDAELIVAFFAIEQLLGGCQFTNCPFAAQTLDAIGPAQTHKQLPAFFIGIEQVYNVN